MSFNKIALSAIQEEEEPPDLLPNSGGIALFMDSSGTLSHVSSVTTVVHLSDDEDDLERPRRTPLYGLNTYDPEKGLPENTLGRLSFCIFDMRRPTRRWLEMLDREYLHGAFFYALDYYTKRKPEYRFIHENVYLSKVPSAPEEYSLWIKGVCKYVMKELRTQYCLKKGLVVGGRSNSPK